jgi:hypothetical protein
MTDYKKYSLEQVENFLYDAMSTEATPTEIYDVIKKVVEDNYYTYKVQTQKAEELLSLLTGHRHVDFDDKDHSEYYYDYDRNKAATKTCDKDDSSQYCKDSWNDFWDNQYSEETLDAMCDAAEKTDKVKKWILPVEADGPSGEYFITFPDDLLEAANLEEGDQVNWIDNGDGSYTMTKVSKPLKMNEC